MPGEVFMKIINRFECFAAAAFLLATALFSAGCASSKEVAIASQSVSAEASVAEVNKYGNCVLNLSDADFIAKGFAAGDIVSVKIGTYTERMPVCTSFSDVDHGKPLVRLADNVVTIAINMGNFSKASSASVGSPVTLRLSEKGGYLSQFAVRKLTKSDERSDYASDEIFANFRPVKAGKIAANRLYRSCNPVLGDARAPYAAKLVESAGIKTVINLADNSESAATHIADSPYYENLLKNGNVTLLNMGVSFTDDDFVKKLHEGLVFMIAHKEGPYLVHCNEGKDRAGYVNALLEALCGATIEEMTEDYMLSFENYYGVKKDTEQYRLISKNLPDMFKKMNDGKAVTNENIASVAESYLLNRVGLKAEELAELKAILQ